MLIAGDTGPHRPLAETEVHSADYPSLQAMVKEFLTQVKMSVDVASFDVAGPVINGHVKNTNLPWVLDEDTLAKNWNLEAAHLMNDLKAVARAVPALRAEGAINKGGHDKQRRVGGKWPDRHHCAGNRFR